MGHGKVKRWKGRAKAAFSRIEALIVQGDRDLKEKREWREAAERWKEQAERERGAKEKARIDLKAREESQRRTAEEFEFLFRLVTEAGATIRYSGSKPVALEFKQKGATPAPGFQWAQVPIGPDWNGALYKGERADWWADQVEKYKEERAEVREEADRERKRREEAENRLAAEKQISENYARSLEAEQTLRKEAESRYRKALASSLDASDRSLLQSASITVRGWGFAKLAGLLRALSEKGIAQTEASAGAENTGPSGAVQTAQAPETD